MNKTRGLRGMTFMKTLGSSPSPPPSHNEGKVNSLKRKPSSFLSGGAGRKVGGLIELCVHVLYISSTRRES
jgi:hypothetical protein